MDFEFDPALPQVYGTYNDKIKEQYNQLKNKYQGMVHFSEEKDIRKKQVVETLIQDIQKRARIFDEDFEGLEFMFCGRGLSSES